MVSHLSTTVIASLSESLRRKKQRLPPGADHEETDPMSYEVARALGASQMQFGDSEFDLGRPGGRSATDCSCRPILA